MTPFDSQAGWNAAQIAADTSWVMPLDAAWVNNIIDVTRHAMARSGCGDHLFGYTRRDFDFSPGVRDLLEAVATELAAHSGMVLLKGMPVDDLDLATARTLYWGLGLHLGIPRPQGKLSQFMSNVRDEGGTYRSTRGRGYNTNSRLDFHSDGSDLVGLICLKQAREGGDSMVTHSLHAWRVMQSERPDLAERLFDLFVFSRQGEEAADEPPWYRASVLGEKNGRLFCRYVRNHINSAQLAFEDIPRMTPQQIEALDLFDATLARPALCYRMRLEKGDIQWLNNHVVLHSRTAYVDHDEPAEKRHLLRLWLASYRGEELPDNWRDCYKSTQAHSVRGGFKGTQITEEVRAYVHRLARETAMDAHAV